MLRFILILAALTWCCQNPFRLVYTNDGPLCHMQDSIIKIYNAGRTIDKQMMRDLKINWWVRTAEKAAPGNLIIRQYCLIDLFSGKACHTKRIQRMINTISGGPGEYRTWAESYTYWKYTQMMLVPWLNKFKDDSIITMSNAIEKGFAYTAYERTSRVFYPAPFGDLWEVPLDSGTTIIAKEICNDTKYVKMKNVTREWDGLNVVYSIAAMPMGLNGHCEKEQHIYVVKDGIPMGFKYYEGYDKKYKNKEAEWTDLLDPRRLFTIPFIW